MSVTAFAAHAGLNRVTPSRILNGHASITADMDLRIGPWHLARLLVAPADAVRPVGGQPASQESGTCAPSHRLTERHALSWLPSSTHPADWSRALKFSPQSVSIPSL